MKRRAALGALLGLALIPLSLPALAQQDNTGRANRRFGGAVQGSVTQIQGTTLKVMTEASQEPIIVNLTGDTRFVRRIAVKPADLKAGQRLTIMGTEQTDGGKSVLQAFRVQVGETGNGNRPGGGGANRGPGGNRGNFRAVQGTVSTASPLAVKSADGTEYAVELGPQVRIDRTEPLTASSLKVGDEVRVMGERTPEGAVNATLVELGGDPAPRTGTVGSASADSLEVTPRAGGRASKVQLQGTTRIYRMENLEPADLKVGDKVTVRVRQTEGSAGPAIASSILLGEALPMGGAFGRGGALGARRPGSGGGAGAGAGGGAAAGNRQPLREIVGEVVKTSDPLTIKTDQGNVELQISGQTRVQRSTKVTAAGIKSGEPVYVQVRRGDGGALVADTVILGMQAGRGGGAAGGARNRSAS